MARRSGYCPTLRKCLVIVVVLFCLSAGILHMILQYFDTEDIYEDDGIWLQNEQHFAHVDYGGKLVSSDGTDEHDRDHVNVTNLNIKVPIILWWTPFTGERGQVKQCGKDECFFTVDRHFRNHPQTKVFMFYGTDFKPRDLPLPRKKQHEWALLHEESPKNNYILTQKDCLTLFNHTATFKRQSDYPITTQYLEHLSDLTSTEYLVPTDLKSRGGIAQVVYIHSDCNPPSGRDNYVTELMKFIRVDSYGKCLHNKDLPPDLVDPLTMHSRDLYKIIAKYKFSLAFENAICDDYVTEKLWRPLLVGSVPVYRGSPSVRDWLPDNQSAVIADDFSSPEDLAKFLTSLAGNKERYEKYLKFKKVGITNKKLINTMTKREWGVNDYERLNFISGFECFVCKRVHENLKRSERGEPLKPHKAEGNHYNCPRPQYSNENYRRDNDIYLQMYDRHKKNAVDLRKLVEEGLGYDSIKFRDLMSNVY
ncbi:alpha-(1,3)-fucosyltransferase 10-like [Asterias rubens]|uniref:alpha-(1,3)-fucosyltransferase 10-like n=1 Tax=Asterias rubens TaxID=7604 RepID=UPI0014554910|nr:alpha-(1,3)-fucosyltransferase 10-like [Asterias rubens]